MLFRDRIDAGRRLASQLKTYAHRDDTIVLALPRGGVPIGEEIAKAIDAPLDVLVVRKLGVPGREELAMGAIATGGATFVANEIVRSLRVPPHAVDRVVAAEKQELERRERAYRDGRPAPNLRGRTAILVDDGLATGATMQAAVTVLRREQPARLVVAVPVSAPETCREFEAEVDEITCAETPQPFYSVGLWYDEFSQVSDSEVREALQRHRERRLTEA